MKSDYDGITHNEIYDELQNRYFETRNSKVLGQMYCVAKEAGANYIRKYCKQRGLFNLDINELSHEAALFVIEQYLKKPEFKVEKISAYIHFGTKKALFKNKDVEMNELSYEELIEQKNKKRYI
jgi:hypothetical protein